MATYAQSYKRMMKDHKKIERTKVQLSRSYTLNEVYEILKLYPKAIPVEIGISSGLFKHITFQQDENAQLAILLNVKKDTLVFTPADQETEARSVALNARKAKKPQKQGIDAIMALNKKRAAHFHAIVSTVTDLLEQHRG